MDSLRDLLRGIGLKHEKKTQKPTERYTFHYLKPSKTEYPQDRVTVTKLNVKNAKCYLLENVISSGECKYYKESSEKFGYESLNKEYPTEYRNNERVLVKSTDLA
ncbi:PyrE-like protein [Acrasis kona]|uniref:PyrE-like protein n=1 Tax=Acrasis kona TaxID=1008807 RepID=A0AAW2ZI79_9EUKA